ncbi:TolC family protein [Chitinophaga sp. sic0106]|uniref:TolC family protein n=1 Tax=Chitinophaga sp. sic0106 TaxID=2854785 RepID=UPI001C467722|nr:TolC family protein [Chitinophaga sp. sic0106]MBV7531449.1 TolC family protein [Chitinophaga sp. sic0106]
MSTLITKGALLISAIIATFSANAQQSVLDGYVQEAFQSNKGLKDQYIQLDKSLYALKEAKTLFSPDVSLLSSYVKSGGGRTIDLPLGDMMNPVYSTLNQLTNSHNFSTLSNEKFQLNPDNFLDTKLRTSMPLINAEIYYNQQIKQEQLSQQQAAVNVFKRQLVQDVKAAYFQYYQACQAVAIYHSALSLINENIRINESLVRNGVRNNTALYRSRTEKEKTEASINEATNTRENAKAYFNFLLNKNLQDSIQLDSNLLEVPAAQVYSADINGREELQQYKHAVSALQLNTKLQRSYLVPKLNTFLDLGTQGAPERFDNTTRYYFFGVNLEWNIFNFHKSRYRIKQAETSMQSVSMMASQTEDQLRLQLQQARNTYGTAIRNYSSAKSQLDFAERYYRDQLKIYKEGQLLYLELLDAQNQLTQARLQTSVTQAAVQTAFAGVERAQASYPINNNK